ncbi:MAG: CDP-diacylglycerol--glycerol-3-phosphate 3-phosphatidyltransferase [Albidovulum sp.]|nr:CDP-diacylglycerol--glycerol-3-phosphate 3-phosphatidyltransferase [Albidovulum sp.]MDE0531645.1 CDP-diacylglycerol--glycerol-3-phosphate 3-phosphatidyltransferase [Albidovulum sp.]
MTISARIPNILTTARLAVSPLLVLVFLILPYSQASVVAAAIFAAATITDFLDGFLARRFDLISNLGKVLDPIADKALVVIALLAVAANSGLDSWFLVPATAIVFREIFIAGLREQMSGSSVELGTTGIGKTKAATQMAAIFLLLLSPALSNYSVEVELIGLFLLWAAAILSVVSAVIYFRKTLPYL